MTLAFYTRYALRSLARGGQRTLLALLCISFGVLSLVAMQLLAAQISATLIVDPRAVLDGDALLTRGGDNEGGIVAAADLAGLAQLQADGILTGVCPMAQQYIPALKPPGSGPAYLLSQQPLGIDPEHCPLVGAVTLRDPAGTTFQAAIRRPLGVVLSRDLADRLDLHVGDHFTLLGAAATTATTLTVTGIAQDTPDKTGEHVVYSLDTARRLAGTPDVVTSASVTYGSGSPAVARLQAAGWHVATAAHLAAQGGGNVAQVFDFMLKGAGILGLIVGGIGVANTLQVSLARRQLEIAMLKTLGYRRRDLLALFGIETALLGLAGGVLGAAAGVGVAAVLSGLLERVGLFLLSWSLDPRIVLGGVLAGVLTSAIFGLFAIVQASAVRPATLLRNLPGGRGWRTWLASAGLLLVLVALFTAISSVVMGALLDGAEIVGAAIAGLIGFTLLLSAILFVLLRVPLPQPPLLRLARQNLKRRPLRSIFPLIALFMGVFSIGFSGGTILDAGERVNSQRTATGRYNLTIYSRQADAAGVARQLTTQGVTDVHVSTLIPIARGQGPHSAFLPGATYLDGRAPADSTWDAQVTQGQWTAASDAALVPASLAEAPIALQVGDPLTVTVGSGQTLLLHVSGFYESQVPDVLFGTRAGIHVSQAIAGRLAGPDTQVTFSAAVPAGALARTEATLAAALPDATLLSTADVNDWLARRLGSLLNFVVGVAGLALVAGAILIANGVGLALIERRRELGILKAVGFSAGRVLGTLLLENALLGLLAGVLGMVAVAGAMAFVNTQTPAAELSLNPILAVGMVALSIALALSVTALVAWQPTHVRPLAVLRDE
jgi:putative ABC transport system permease protein